jgi:alpha-glucosidase
MKALRTLALLTLAATTFAPACLAQMAAPMAAQTGSATGTDPWWKHAVFYEIYPRSFQDSNGDGNGDINGITERLGYLRKLGIDAIWIAPCYPSPQADFGYDISDYENIDPQYGTLADFDRMLADAKKHDIRIIMDMVLNHTSDKHKWFEESASSKDNPKRDWYIWRDGKIGPDGKMGPPNNWLSEFGHSAWTFDAKTGQYYYHKFYAGQPDLNWRNPAVEKAMFDQMRFWLDRGVAGFRLDAIPTLFEDPTLADEDYRRNPDGSVRLNDFGDKEVTGDKTENLPEVHDVIRRMRAMASSYPGDRVLIGETYLPNIQALDMWYGGEKKDELQLPMDMQVGFYNHLDAGVFRKRINEVETQVHGSAPLLVTDNHDNPRLDRYCTERAGAAPNANCDQIQKMLATVLFTTKDAAMFYYGDEIGMLTHEPTRVEDVRDPVGVTGWPKVKGRDGERTPMQWTPGKDAGFSTAAKTWLPIPPEYVTVNVQTESKEKGSMLEYYEKVIALRHEYPAMLDGEEAMLATSDDKDVLAYSRGEGAGKMVVLCNFSGGPQTVSITGMDGKQAHIVAASFDAPKSVKASGVSLPAYGAIVAKVE